MKFNYWQLINIAKEAGGLVLEVYSSDFDVELKADSSPLTLADKKSHNSIVQELKRLFPDIPVLSEEGKDIPYEERNGWETFWLVDPLDGTKEFLKRNGEFTVNIALIHKNSPIAGVIYVPVTDTSYFAEKKKGAYKLQGDVSLKSDAKKLPAEDLPKVFTVVASRSHMTPETENYCEKLKQKHGAIDLVSSGSSLKFCLVAEKKAHVYPRFAPTMEWDTAAGQIIAEEAGCFVINTETQGPLQYNKENLLNPWFIVGRA